jgi:hypothetical protein
MAITLNTAWQAEELWWTSSVFVDKNFSLTVLGILLTRDYYLVGASPIQWSIGGPGDPPPEDHINIEPANVSRKEKRKHKHKQRGEPVHRTT